MHGDMAQERRSAVVEGLLDARYSVIVTTNVLGRGLDLANVRQVGPCVLTLISSSVKELAVIISSDSK